LTTQSQTADRQCSGEERGTEGSNYRSEKAEFRFRAPFVSITGSRSVTTDREGSYGFSNLSRASTGSLSRELGFPLKRENLIIRAGENATLNFKLNRRAGHQQTLGLHINPQEELAMQSHTKVRIFGLFFFLFCVGVSPITGIF